MNILGLDMATRTGWACNIHGRRSGVIEFAVKRGESPGMRFLRCRSWLNEMLKLLERIDLIAYEQAHHRGGAATACCVGLVTEVLAFAAEHDVETMPSPSEQTTLLGKTCSAPLACFVDRAGVLVLPPRTTSSLDPAPMRTPQTSHPTPCLSGNAAILERA